MKVDQQLYLQAFEKMCKAKAMTTLYEERKDICAKYVHATSRGHETIQLAAALQLKPQDFVYPYYRDDSMLLAMGFTPYDLMLQLLAKGSDYFSGGRTYYSHPSSNRADLPKIPHQSSATGMQAIPATGSAQGIQYKEIQGIETYPRGEEPIVLCSLGDACVTEGEVAEAFQMAALHQFPILYLVQDNDWDISAHSSEIRAMDASEYAKGFKGIEVISIDGTDPEVCFQTLYTAIKKIRETRKPILVHAKVPLLNHHTSGVRKEWYRSPENLEQDAKRDPFPKFRAFLLNQHFADENALAAIENAAILEVHNDFENAVKEASPDADELYKHIFAPGQIIEGGNREPQGGEVVMMVDAALHAVDEILAKHPEALLYGQDVGGELGGVFREAALLAKKYGDERVFNTPIMEAYIIGSTVGHECCRLQAHCGSAICRLYFSWGESIVYGSVAVVLFK
jgi:2-oxoisovalerate dehydrogenase E1 component